MTIYSAAPASLNFEGVGHYRVPSLHFPVSRTVPLSVYLRWENYLGQLPAGIGEVPLFRIPFDLFPEMTLHIPFEFTTALSKKSLSNVQPPKRRSPYPDNTPIFCSSTAAVGITS